MNSTSFTAKDAWSGGYYELVIRLGMQDDTRLGEVLRACTDFPLITGWYRRRDVEPDVQKLIIPTPADVARGDNLFGLMELPGVGTVVCACLLIRDETSNID